MTTGGGTRSFTTTFGTLRGLQKLNLIDCVTYMSGLSGTCWAMAQMYRDAYWSHRNMDELICEAKKHVTKSKMGVFSIDRMKYYQQQLNKRKEEGYKTTFIDLWGLMIEYLLHDGKDNHKLSDQREALTEGQNPLPIYVTLNIKEKYSTQDFKEWVEFTPYEVGFLKYGTFVCPENFGSEFFMGRMIKKLPESRISYLHGMWSSIFSVNLLYLLNKVNNSEEFWHRWTRDKIIDIEEDPNLPTRPYELKSHMFVPAGNLSSAFRGFLTDRLSVAQSHNFLKGLQLHNDYLENEQFQRWKATVLDYCPNQLTEHDDYLGLPLEEACKFYSEQGIPFPNVVLTEEDKKNPKECYYFNQTGSPECPQVLFFPLVNDTFQHYRAPGEKRNDDEMHAGNTDVSSTSSPYGTHLLTYSEEDFDKLVNLSEYNIMNNQHIILQALHDAVARKRQCYHRY
ncbi:cytosolic phospholipase A2 epsilon-like [Sphaerodactylus townsendi]|uniref:cytosolic phospholipase A2 epsilon-like n=1 Tax=Sphaerodactylus townsendi TaxID=933632 RepID=UPI0020268877|nr:cytosolic phospholipase A2 epsilon-like [Sphaerodactylus townsendi]